MEADQLSISRRFKTFTTQSIAPSYYREEARDSIRPLRASDLPHALDVAYRLRSRNVHELRDLAPELWVIASRADTIYWEGRQVLSLEGLNRLTRHVVRQFVASGPTHLDATFDYRKSLPGIVNVQLVPEYRIGDGSHISVRNGSRSLATFVELLISVLQVEGKPIPVNLNNGLENIERLLPGTKTQTARRPLVAIYVLWNRLLNPEVRREKAEEFIDRFSDDLSSPSIEGFCVRVILGLQIEWSTSQLLRLAGARMRAVRRGKGVDLPSRIDTALLLATAMSLSADGRAAEAAEYVSHAVESAPGQQAILSLEEQLKAGSMPDINLQEVVLSAP